MSITEYKQDWRAWKLSLEKKSKHDLIRELYDAAKVCHKQQEELAQAKEEIECYKEAANGEAHKALEASVNLSQSNEESVSKGCDMVEDILKLKRELAQVREEIAKQAIVNKELSEQHGKDIVLVILENAESSPSLSVTHSGGDERAAEIAKDIAADYSKLAQDLYDGSADLVKSVKKDLESIHRTELDGLKQELKAEKAKMPIAIEKIEMQINANLKNNEWRIGIDDGLRWFHKILCEIQGQATTEKV